MQFVFQGSKLLFLSGGDPDSEGPYTVDPAKDPKQIDLLHGQYGLWPRAKIAPFNANWFSLAFTRSSSIGSAFASTRECGTGGGRSIFGQGSLG